ncbi:LON peptidase substrate-binding domain-containing protein [Akkermansiaceae bacterium]|nr:LON peptidase substrate-binding domain-containing protein [Akkermansiaceae bacterium]
MSCRFLVLSSDEEVEYLGRLRRAINRTLSSFPSEVNEQVNSTLDKAGDSATCSDAVAQQFIHDPNDRQRLLETPEVRKRIDFLIKFLKKAGPSV